jgi:hypothetical protein
VSEESWQGLLRDVFLHILPHMLGSGLSLGPSQSAVGYSREHSVDRSYLQSVILSGNQPRGKTITGKECRRNT